MTSRDFINHVRSTLDASLQRWEFADFPEYVLDAYRVSVRFASGHTACILWRVGWQVSSDDGLTDWLLARLNAHTRDDAGHFTTELDSNGQPLMSDEVGR